MEVLGKHIICDMAVSLDFHIMEDIDFLLGVIKNALNKASIIFDPDFKIKKFTPQGYTILTVLEESHFHLSTWPEKQFISVDLYTCGNLKQAHHAVSLIGADLFATCMSFKIIDRYKPN
jgi:S-adenosylmethionine decarboxylase